MISLTNPPVLQSECASCRPFVADKNLESCCFLNNETLLTVSANGQLCYWEVGSGKVKSRLQLTDSCLYSISVVKGGQKAVAVSDYDKIILIDLIGGKIIRTIKLPARLSRPVVSPDGARIICDCADGTIRIHELESGKERGAFKPVFLTSLTPVITAEMGSEISTQTLPFTLRPQPYNVSLSSDGRFLAASYFRVTEASDKHVHVWDVFTGEHHGDYRVKSSFGGPLVFHPTCPTALTVTGIDNKSICMWDVAVGRPSTNGTLLPDWAKLLRYSSDGSVLACVSNDGSIFTIRGSDEAKILHKFTSQNVGINELAFSPDGTILAVKIFDVRNNMNEVYLWHLASRPRPCRSGRLPAPVPTENTAMWELRPEAGVRNLQQPRPGIFVADGLPNRGSGLKPSMGQDQTGQPLPSPCPLRRAAKSQL